VYDPKPIDTSGVQLDKGILELTEQLAENAHEVWAQRRLAEGWRYGPQRDEDKKTHPSLVPYERLPESEKEYDRSTALETLKAMLAMGYRIEKMRPGDRDAGPDTEDTLRKRGEEREATGH
jgi:hypothetical protein